MLRKFKAGEFNVLVSTSVGEEGLDIGEVDMIVCYDAQKTPIRMVCHLSLFSFLKEINSGLFCFHSFNVLDELAASVLVLCTFCLPRSGKS